MQTYKHTQLDDDQHFKLQGSRDLDNELYQPRPIAPEYHEHS